MGLLIAEEITRALWSKSQWVAHLPVLLRRSACSVYKMQLSWLKRGKQARTSVNACHKYLFACGCNCVVFFFTWFKAINNTKMLRFYNEIDPRLRVLNIALKVASKVSFPLWAGLVLPTLSARCTLYVWLFSSIRFRHAISPKPTPVASLPTHSLSCWFTTYNRRASCLYSRRLVCCFVFPQGKSKRAWLW